MSFDSFLRRRTGEPPKAAMTLIVCAVGLFSAGCISLAGGQLPDIEVRPLEVPPPSIEQTVGNFSFHLDGGKMITSNKAGRNVNQMVLDRWKKRGLITNETYVKSAQFTGNADYNLTLSGHQEGDSSIVMQVLSGLTLYILPYWVNTQFDLVYSLEHVQSGKVFDARASDGYVSITEILLLPVTPFALGGMRRTYARLGDHLYEQLADQGAFSPETVASGTSDDVDGPGLKHHEPEDGPSAVERLQLLDDLRSEGRVTDEEYDQKKQEILEEL